RPRANSAAVRVWKIVLQTSSFLIVGRSPQAAAGSDGRQTAGQISARIDEIAHLPYIQAPFDHTLDFESQQSGSGPTFTESPMERASIEPAIKLIIAEI